MASSKHFSYDFQSGSQSNYQVVLTLSHDDIVYYNNKVLKDYQKDMKMPGFRKGHVPLSVVADNVYPQYLIMGMTEHMINQSLHAILDEHKDKHFIGQPYDLDINDLSQEDEKKDTYKMSYTIDVYPTCNQKDDTWKTVSPKKISIKVEKKDIEETMKTIQKQYADYETVEQINDQTVARVSIVFLDKGGKELHTKSAYIGEQEMTNPVLKKALMNNKIADKIELAYGFENAPNSFVYANANDDKPVTIMVHIEDIKKQVLPNLTDAFVKKTFGQQDDTGVQITTKKQLEAQIEKTIKERQEQQQIQQSMETWLQEVKKSFECAIPKTFVDAEYEERIKDMKKQLGGDKGYEKFINQMGEKKSATYQAEMKKGVKTTLENYFVLNEVVKVLGWENEVNVNIPSEANIVLYNKLTSKIDNGKKTGKRGKTEENQKTQKTTKSKGGKKTQ